MSNIKFRSDICEGALFFSGSSIELGHGQSRHLSAVGRSERIWRSRQASVKPERVDQSRRQGVSARAAAPLPMPAQLLPET